MGHVKGKAVFCRDLWRYDGGDHHRTAAQREDARQDDYDAIKRETIEWLGESENPRR